MPRCKHVHLRHGLLRHGLLRHGLLRHGLLWRRPGRNLLRGLLRGRSNLVLPVTRGAVLCGAHCNAEMKAWPSSIVAAKPATLSDDKAQRVLCSPIVADRDHYRCVFVNRGQCT